MEASGRRYFLRAEDFSLDDIVSSTWSACWGSQRRTSTVRSGSRGCASRVQRVGPGGRRRGAALVSGPREAG
ncbi:hypothetical protein E2562_035241 [Oryza meyeriana var. granulata]|uniref:Uncharacterized protein n=1 Tax=Oryza meyeriana var. granulata TaxID=110450 RepID=A0A6G1CKX3_9ORYZ|nr:hypothetical protein E2562_035241 [Oryza meyeriana var. granulata]